MYIPFSFDYNLIQLETIQVKIKNSFSKHEIDHNDGTVEGEKEVFMQYTDIRFPHLGIVLSHVGRYISIGDFQIMYYGIIIACGFLVGLLIAQKEAKRTGQNPEIYMDYLLCMVIPAIVGARIYYVAFSWDNYKGNLLEILNLRHGGLGIVGGVTAAILVLLLFAKIRKYSALLMLDTMTMGLLVGQIMGCLLYTSPSPRDCS